MSERYYDTLTEKQKSGLIFRQIERDEHLSREEVEEMLSGEDEGVLNDMLAKYGLTAE